MKRKNNRVSRLPDEAKAQLLECVNALIFDAAAYDKGEFSIIKRSSTTLRMLFYDSKTSHSLINQISNKKILPMQSYIEYPTKKKMFFGYVFCARFWSSPPEINSHYDTFLFSPPNDFENFIPFDDWWDGSIFSWGEDFTRKRLVITIANQDGGAHFDPEIDSSYRSLVNGDTGFHIKAKNNNHIIFGGSPKQNNKDIFFKDLHLALLREIVHETIISLIKFFNLSIEYRPNFDYNWNRKLNKLGFHFNFEEKSK